MTHGSHRLVSHRLGGDPLPRFLTGGLACYRIYETADGRHLTVGALEPKFFVRLCELIGRPELAERQFVADAQDALAAELAAVFAQRPLAAWLELFDGEDVCVGPVATLAEAAAEFGGRTAHAVRPRRAAYGGMAGRARLLLTAVALAPLPLLAAVAWNTEAEAARRARRAVVSVRDGDLFVGERQLTSGGGDSDPDWSPDRRRIAFVRQEPGKRSSSLYVIRRDGGGLQRLTRGDQVVSLPAWRGDGRLIAYAASPLAGGSFDVWTIAPDGGPVRRALTGPAEQIAPGFTRAGKVTARTLEPGEPFPEKTSDSGTPAVGPARAAARPRPARAVPADDRRHEARLRLRDRQRRRGPGLGPRQPARRPSARCARASSSACPTAPCARTTTPADSATRRHRRTPTGTCSTSSATSCARSPASLVVRDRKSGFCLADHYGLARTPRHRVHGRRFFGNCAASNPRALSVEQGTSIGFTDLYPAHFHGQNLELRGVPAGVYLLVHRANPEQRLEELDYTNNDASLRIRLTWNGGTPHVADPAHLPGVRRLLASGEAERRREREEIRQPIGLVRPAAVAVEQERLHPERPRALDVVLVGVADHRRLLRLDPEQRERVPEDLGMRLRAAEGARADRAVGVEPVMGDELVQVAAAVRDQADLDAVLAQRRERRAARPRRA